MSKKYKKVPSILSKERRDMYKYTGTSNPSAIHTDNLWILGPRAIEECDKAVKRAYDERKKV